MARNLLLGYYGFTNFGDDLFNDALISLYNAASSPRPRIPFSSSTASLANSTLPSWMGPLWRRKNRAAGAFRNAITFGLVARSDNVIFGGGSLFESGPRLGQRERLIDFARRSGKRIGAIGVSVGPVEPGDEQNVTRVIGKLDHVYVRDKSSVEFCQRHGVKNARYAHDLALGYVKPKVVQGGNTLGVALHGRRYHGGLRECVLRIARQFDEITLITLDRSPAGWLEQCRRDLSEAGYSGLIRRITYVGDVGATISVLSACRLVITSKLHGAITSYALNVPFLLDEYHPKCTEFINDIGWKVKPTVVLAVDEIEDRWRSEVRANNYASIREGQLSFPLLRL